MKLSSLKLNQKVTVEVKKCDIKKGICGSPSQCAFALAMLRKFKDAVSVGVGGYDYIDVYNGTDPRVWFSGPSRLGTFIAKFDDGRKVKPNKFKVTVISI